jgi:hypothetical protein
MLQNIAIHVSENGRHPCAHDARGAVTTVLRVEGAGARALLRTVLASDFGRLRTEAAWR